MQSVGFINRSLAEAAFPAVFTSIPAVSAVVPKRVLFGRLPEKGELQFLEVLRMWVTCPFHAMGAINRGGFSDAHDRLLRGRFMMGRSLPGESELRCYEERLPGASVVFYGWNGLLEG